MTLFWDRRNAAVARVLIFMLAAVAMNALFFQTLATSTDLTNPDTVKREKEKNAKSKKKLQSDLKRLFRDKRGVEQILDRLDGEIKRAENQLYSVTRTHQKLRSESAFLEHKLKQTNKKYNDYRLRNYDRLVAYYKNGRAGYLEVLFNATSFSDFISRVYYLQLLTKHDLGVVQQMRDLSEKVREQKEAINAHAREMQLQAERLKDEREYNLSLHRQKEQTLSQIESQAALVKQQIAILEQEDQRLEAILRKAMQRTLPGINFTGTFSNPLCGKPLYVSSGFGRRRSPTRGASSNHKGVDFRSSYGQDVCAAADGEVLEASWGRGYGLHVVVLHGSLNGTSYATVYAHGLRTLVSPGQRVKRGQVIMKADSTGISTGNHLHFEVRREGVAIDPSAFY